MTSIIYTLDYQLPLDFDTLLISYQDLDLLYYPYLVSSDLWLNIILIISYHCRT